MLNAPSPTSAIAGPAVGGERAGDAGRRPAHLGHAGADLPGARRAYLHVGLGVLGDVADVDIDATILGQRAADFVHEAGRMGGRSWSPSAAGGSPLPTRRESLGCARASLGASCCRGRLRRPQGPRGRAWHRSPARARPENCARPPGSRDRPARSWSATRRRSSPCANSRCDCRRSARRRRSPDRPRGSRAPRTRNPSARACRWTADDPPATFPWRAASSRSEC